jgi:hypothetical protein
MAGGIAGTWTGFIQDLYGRHCFSRRLRGKNSVSRTADRELKREQKEVPYGFQFPNLLGVILKHKSCDARERAI